MKIALSGTPGVGKTTIAQSLIKRGYKILDLNQIADENEFVTGYDEKRGSNEIDLDGMDEFLKERFGEDDYIIEGHLSHLLSVDFAIILRCNPLVLKKRLSQKKWQDEKIKENVGAEILDVIKVEALEALERVFEVDTTEKTQEEVADAVEEIISGHYHELHIDWLAEYEYLLF